MSWELAIVSGTVGLAFYLLYLKSHVQNQALQLLLILTSVFTALTSAALMFEVVTQSSPGATKLISLTTAYYGGFVAFATLFISFIMLQLIGGWLKSWERRR